MLNNQLPSRMFGEVPSSLLSMDLALSEAMDNITSLQNDLGFMLTKTASLNDQLDRERNRTDELGLQLKEKNKAHLASQRKTQQCLGLYEQLRESFNATEDELKAAQREEQRLNRIISQQQQTIRNLEDEALQLRYGAHDTSEPSLNICIPDLALEKQNQSLREELEEYKSKHLKDSAKLKRAEKDVSIFRNWLKELSGVYVLSEGCEELLLKEISSRLGNKL